MTLRPARLPDPSFFEYTPNFSPFLDGTDRERGMQLTPWFGTDVFYVAGQGWVSRPDLDAGFDDDANRRLDNEARQFAEACVGQIGCYRLNGEQGFGGGLAGLGHRVLRWLSALLRGRG